MDERKELAMLVQKDISAELGKKKPPEGPLAERIADHIIAAGYRKREKVVFTSDFRMAFGQTTDHPTGTGYRKLSPAQSVGQSAAQGVGEFAAELVKWCDEHLAAHPDVTVRTTLAFVIDHIRRLSALPKGQDDE